MRRLLVPVVLVATLVAGCAEPVAPAAVDPEDLLAPGFTALTAIVDPEGGRGEPSLGVMPDGTLFTIGRTDELRAPKIYRSADEGATWEDLGSPTSPMRDGDPDLIVDKDGTVWASSLTIVSSSVAVSRDGGETFTVNHLATGAPVADRQYVIPTEGGEAYIYAHQLPTFHQMVAKTTDFGATWVPLGSMELGNLFGVTQSSGWGGGGFWNEATGSVFFTWTINEGIVGNGWRPGFAVTRDGGATFEQGAVEGERGRSLGLSLVTGAADEAGNVYLTWGEADEADDVAIYYAASTDDGRTWNEPVRVDVGKNSSVFPTIAAGAPGKIAIAYYEADEQAFPDDVQGSWNVTLAYVEDALSAAPTIRHGELSNGTVKEGPICISGTTCEGGREFLDYFQIRALPDGRVGGVFNRMDGETLLTSYGATRDAILQ